MNATPVIKVDFHNSKSNCEGAKMIAEALKKNVTLIQIGFSYNDIKDEGATAIAEMLKTNTTLEILDLSFNCIGDAGAKAIAEALKINKTLIGIDLRDTCIGSEGEIALSQALWDNSTKAPRNNLKIFLTEEALLCQEPANDIPSSAMNGNAYIFLPADGHSKPELKAPLSARPSGPC